MYKIILADSESGDKRRSECGEDDSFSQAAGKEVQRRIPAHR